MPKRKPNAAPSLRRNKRRKVNQSEINFANRKVQQLFYEDTFSEDVVACNLKDNKLKSVFAKLPVASPDLAKINLSGNRNIDFSPLYRLNSLTHLVIRDVQLKSEDLHRINECKTLAVLDVSQNLLEFLPIEVTMLKHLQCFRAESNRLTNLPNAISDLKNLQVLNVCKNRLTHLPTTIGGLPCLITLWAAENCLRTIGPEIGALKSLESLFLQKNQLRKLPTDIINLQGLKQVDISQNHIRELPKGVPELMKSLRRFKCFSNLLTRKPTAGSSDFLMIDWEPQRMGLNRQQTEILNADKNDKHFEQLKNGHDSYVETARKFVLAMQRDEKWREEKEALSVQIEELKKQRSALIRKYRRQAKEASLLDGAAKEKSKHVGKLMKQLVAAQSHCVKIQNEREKLSNHLMSTEDFLSEREEKLDDTISESSKLAASIRNHSAVLNRISKEYRRLGPSLFSHNQHGEKARSLGAIVKSIGGMDEEVVKKMLALKENEDSLLEKCRAVRTSKKWHHTLRSVHSHFRKLRDRLCLVVKNGIQVQPDLIVKDFYYITQEAWDEIEPYWDKEQTKPEILNWEEIKEVAPHLLKLRQRVNENINRAVHEMINRGNEGKQQCEVRESKFLSSLLDLNPNDKGKGLYTDIPRKAGDVLGIFHGEICSHEQCAEWFFNSNCEKVFEGSSVYTIPFSDDNKVYLNPSFKSKSINDCREHIYSQATETDLERLNVVWVEVRYRGLIYVFEVISRNLQANTELLTFYGDQYDFENHRELQEERNKQISLAEKIDQGKDATVEEVFEKLIEDRSKFWPLPELKKPDRQKKRKKNSKA